MEKFGNLPDDDEYSKLPVRTDSAGVVAEAHSTHSDPNSFFSSGIAAKIDEKSDLESEHDDDQRSLASVTIRQQKRKVTGKEAIEDFFRRNGG
jgi:hypothetical protein